MATAVSKYVTQSAVVYRKFILKQHAHVKIYS